MSVIQIAIPIEHQGAANRLAALMDPDEGGANTFQVEASLTGEAPATHLICSTYMRPAFQSVLGNPAEAQPLLEQLAMQTGRPSPDPEDVQVFCSEAIFGESIPYKKVNPQD